MGYWMMTRKPQKEQKKIGTQRHSTLSGKVQQRMFQVPADPYRPIVTFLLLRACTKSADG
jgi:hypothetical protein